MVVGIYVKVAVFYLRVNVIMLWSLTHCNLLWQRFCTINQCRVCTCTYGSPIAFSHTIQTIYAPGALNVLNCVASSSSEPFIRLYNTCHILYALKLFVD